MAKKIFVMFLNDLPSGDERIVFQDRMVPLFDLFPYEEWMIEADIVDVIRKNFVDMFKGRNLTIDYYDKTGKEISLEEAAEATIGYAMKEGWKFWMVVDEGDPDLFDKTSKMVCINSCLNALAHERSWT